MPSPSATRPRSPTRRRRSPRAQVRGWKAWLRTNWRSVATLAVVAIAVSVAWGRLDMNQVHRQAETVPAGLAFALMVVLPLLGCPATVVNLGAGVRFGIAGGLPLVALACVLHQVIAFGLVRWKPKLFGHLVDPIRRRLPKASHGSLTVFAALLPGVPYWMLTYALPLMGVPLRLVLLYAVPLHVVRSMIALIGGHVSEHLTVGWLVALGAYSVALMSVCAYAGRRMRAQIKKSRSRRPRRDVEEPEPTYRAALVGGGK